MNKMTYPRGYFGIGIENTKTEQNIGTLWRSALIFGASYIFTINRRYKKQSSDTPCTWKQIPLFHYNSFEEFYDNIPYANMLVGVELDSKAVPINRYCHFPTACYLLGSEDNGLSKSALDKCKAIIQLPGEFSMNVATAGGLVMYDRWSKSQK